MAETASLREIPTLSGVRGFAALWLLTHHARTLGGPAPIAFDVAGARIDFTMIVIMGWAGVDIFFVLSAFLLTLPFAGARLGLVPPPSSPDYFRRRALRILPAYYAQSGSGWAKLLLVNDAASLAVAILSYYFVERPFLRLGRLKPDHPGLETMLPAAR